MNRAEMEFYNRHEENERREREKLHKEISEYYNGNNVYITETFLELLRHKDTFIYTKLLNKEFVPVEIIKWLKTVVK